VHGRIVGRVECDVCGRLVRRSELEPCEFCRLNICAECFCFQRRRGHVEAEHKHEAERC
jgi:hypothetical protein